MKAILNTLLFLTLAVQLPAQLKYSVEYSEENGDKAAIKDNESGKLITPYQYDEVEMLNSWMGTIRLGKKSGLIDLSRGNIYCCEYDEINEFDDNAYPGMKGIVSAKGKHGLVGINRDNGKLDIIIPLEYSSIDQNNDFANFYTVKKGGKYGIFNFQKRSFVLPCKYSKYPLIDSYGDFLVMYCGKNRSGLFDADGKEILAAKYSNIEALDQSATLFEVYDGKKVGRYDAVNRNFIVEPIQGDVIGELVLDRYLNIAVKNGKKWPETYIDTKSGKPILPLDYEVMTFFKDQKLAIIKKGKKYGIYDFEKQQIVVDCKYGNEDEILEKEAKILFKLD